MSALIIGYGSIAKKHIQAMHELNYTKTIYALRSNLNAEQIDGIQNIFSLKELSETPDFALISNPTSLHYQTIKNCLVMNCPLFIEKPLFDKLESYDKLVKDIHQKNIKTYIACNLRFHPAIQHLKNWIDRSHPVINEVNVYCGSHLPDWRPSKDFRQIYSANADMGGGVHLDLIHEIDYCYWLFGKPIRTEKLLRSSSHLNISSIDYANYRLVYESFVVNIILNYYRRDTKREIEIVTNEVTINTNLLTAVISSSDTTVFQETPFENYTITDTYSEQLKYFMKAIQKEEVLMNDINEALEVLQITLADV